MISEKTAIITFFVIVFILMAFMDFYRFGHTPQEGMDEYIDGKPRYSPDHKEDEVNQQRS